MASEPLYSLEVKVPDGSGGYTTKKVKLDYEANIDNKPLVFGTRFEFPSIGEEEKIYIATDEQRIYRFDTAESVYRIIGSDWNEIELIDCGGAV